MPVLYLDNVSDHAGSSYPGSSTHAGVVSGLSSHHRELEEVNSLESYRDDASLMTKAAGAARVSGPPVTAVSGETLEGVLPLPWEQRPTGGQLLRAHLYFKSQDLGRGSSPPIGSSILKGAHSPGLIVPII